MSRNWEECLLFLLLVTPRTRETMSSEQPGTCDSDVETVFWRDVISQKLDQRNQSRSANVYGMSIPALSERSRCVGCPKSRDDPRVTKIVDRLFYVQIIQISRTDAAVSVPSKKSFPTRTAVHRLTENRVIISDRQIEDKIAVFKWIKQILGKRLMAWIIQRLQRSTNWDSFDIRHKTSPRSTFTLAISLEPSPFAV